MKIKALKPHFENQLFKKHYVYWVFGSTFFPPHTDLRNEYLFAKVGIADDTGRRIQSMQTDCPVVLHTVFGIPCPSKREAAALESAFLRADELKGYCSHGEWFIVWGGQKDHSVFLRKLLVLFYLYRNARDGFLNVCMEWIASPFARPFRELVPGSDEKMLTVPQEARIRTQLSEFESDCCLDAEIKAEAIVKRWCEREEELKRAYVRKKAHSKGGAAHLDLALKSFPMRTDDWKQSWFVKDQFADSEQPE